MPALSTSSALALSALLVVSAGAGASVVAESALPGDVLYPVKTGVNENIRSGLALSTLAQAEVEANLAERRLEEMIDLAHQGSLNAETQATLAAEFQAHADQALKLSTEASDEGNAYAAYEAMTEFHADLTAYGDVLSELRSSNDTRDQALVIINLTSKTKADVTRAGASFESKAQVDGSAKMEDADTDEEMNDDDSNDADDNTDTQQEDQDEDVNPAADDSDSMIDVDADANADVNLGL